MSVTWESSSDYHKMRCSNGFCNATLTCTHIYDAMANRKIELPSGIVQLGLAAEVPNIFNDGPPRGEELTVERQVAVLLRVSDPKNRYGSRKIEIPAVGDGGYAFLTIFNPEDSMMFIFTALDTFIQTQVSYKPGEEFGHCKGRNHSMEMQHQLQQLRLFLPSFPTLEDWDKLGKILHGSCVACLWKRYEFAPMPGAGAGLSGL